MRILTDRTLRLAAGACLALALPAQDRPADEDAKPAAEPAWYAMDYGPCLATTIEGFQPDNVALKGRAIFLGDDAAVVFDTELLRVATAFVGASLELRGTPFDGAHGPIPRARGDEVFSTMQAPGWAKDGSFIDPRPIPHGPLPKDHGRFLGHYIHGDEVVLSYQVAGRSVLESFAAVRDQSGAAIAIERTMEIGPGLGIRTLLFEVDEPVPGAEDVEIRGAGGTAIAWRAAPAEGEAEGVLHSTAVAFHANGIEPRLLRTGGRVELFLPMSQQTSRVQATFQSGPGDAIKLISPPGAIRELSPLTEGGPRRYPEVLTTRGQLGGGDGPFVVDTLTVPASNPWNSRLRFGAFDFLDEHRAALSTWNGDVWIVDGIDADLDELQWTRFCTGLHDPLGLKVVDGTIYTHGRDGIHRLHDLNGDGGCDFVEVFNNDVLITKGFHEFAFDLQTDAAGNFYFSKGGPVNPGGRGFQKIVPHHGTIMRVAKDGSQLEVVATGVRAPNGIGVGPDGTITSGDNEGTWVPACRINTTRNGTFFGCSDLAHRDPPPTRYDDPICFLPMSVDNSGGGQVWVPDGVWGPLAGELLHQSYGQCNVYLVLRQEVEGHVQGGVVRLPADFASSQMRGRFHGGDLYTAGFKGWQTRAVADTAFQRMRRSDAALHLPIGMQTFAEGIELRFSDPLDAETAGDPESWEIEVWNYLWSGEYGSPEVRPSEPDKKVRAGEKNRDALPVESVELGDDGRRVFLSVPGLTKVMQIRIAYNVDAADGALVEGEIHGSIHALPPRPNGSH